MIKTPSGRLGWVITVLRDRSVYLFLRFVLLPHLLSGAWILTSKSVMVYAVQVDWIRLIRRRPGSSHGYTSLLKLTSTKSLVQFTFTPSDVKSRGPNG